MGCSDSEACVYAEISTSTLYSYQKDTPAFLERKEVLKSKPVMLARKVILDALEAGDVSTAHRVIDRKEGSKVTSRVEMKRVDDATGLTDEELEIIAAGGTI